MDSLLANFEGIAFKEWDTARTRLEPILEGAPQGFARHFAEALNEAANPDRVVLRMDQFLTDCTDRRAHLDALAHTGQYCRLLCAVFDHSQFLAEIVRRQPESALRLPAILENDPVEHRLELLSRLRTAVVSESAFVDRCIVLRRFYQREILRIGVRDVFLHATVEEVTADLSSLADATLQVALEDAQRDLTKRFGTPTAEDGREATLVVLGMGKLGGVELNFSSDIDLVFVYSDEGETNGPGQTLSNAEFFQRVGELIIRAMTEPTAEGHIFRVDMRLRPHGRMGPLAMSLDSTVLYFESQGHAWERQALIKARPVAGDLNLGAAFLERTRPFVFPRYFDDGTLEEIRDTKRRMEQEVEGRGETERGVKLGRGGIRDIEFTVQMLQLLNGGQQPALRKPNSLEAIEALGKAGLLSAFEALTLARHYTYFRTVEHRLQIEGSRQRHVLPSDPAELEDFGKRMGYQSGDAFMVGYRDRKDETRAILERFFATEGSGDLWVGELLHPQSEGYEGIARLEAAGFKDGLKARRELMALHAGPDGRPHPARVRRLFREVAPKLIESLAAAPGPDVTLVRLSQMLANVRAPGVIYDILRLNPELGDALVTLASNSRYLADFIIRDPGLFETFGHAGALDAEVTAEELAGELTLLRRAHDPHVALYRLRDAQTLRIGMRELLGKADVLTVGRELSRLADLCVQECLNQARSAIRDRFGPLEASFAVLAFGKLGGSEMGYGSDLDLVFVYESQGTAAPSVSATEYFATVSARLIKNLTERTRYGMLYDVDARLRPDGQKGMLAVSQDRLEDYYRHEAQAWERTALVKTRAIAGDRPFTQRVEKAALDFAYASGLSRNDLESVESMRKRLAAESLPSNLKKSEGGIAEIEFTARLLQLRHGEQVPKAKQGRVLDALAALEAASRLSREDREALEEAYLFFRRVENRIRMFTGRGNSALPAQAKDQAELGARLGIKGDLVDAVAKRKTIVHGIYTRIYSQMLDFAGPEVPDS